MLRIRNTGEPQEWANYGGGGVALPTNNSASLWPLNYWCNQILSRI